jgi:hypothetical protein
VKNFKANVRLLLLNQILETDSVLLAESFLPFGAVFHLLGEPLLLVVLGQCLRVLGHFNFVEMPKEGLEPDRLGQNFGVMNEVNFGILDHCDHVNFKTLGTLILAPKDLINYRKHVKRFMDDLLVVGKTHENLVSQVYEKLRNWIFSNEFYQQKAREDTFRNFSGDRLLRLVKKLIGVILLSDEIKLPNRN